MNLRKIEILEKESNKKGDLFGRLMSDFFHTLGYDEPRINIHKTGKEIDLSSTHRTENKIAIAECKAQKETIGGSDINKFIGVLDVEKKKLKKSKQQKKFGIVGYYVSLSGFKESAIEQEEEIDNKRIILIKSSKIIEELIRGKVLVSLEKAISSLSLYTGQLTIIDYADLLAYNKGWIWAFYFSNCDGQKATHLALVHAEGKLLIKSLANEIIKTDQNINNIFKGLSLVNQDEPGEILTQQIEDTRKRYFQYLENELGEIHFEGLPTDKEAGSVKVKLENIFVPLMLNQSQPNRKKEELDLEDSPRKGIGEILSERSRLAILAKPGGGKSTLLKRIAMAYAFPDRRNLINDKLPDNDWFPIFIRCRELGEKVTLSVTEIINSIPARAEIGDCTECFSRLISQILQNGNALLLIDGLDEIAEDKNRISFVNQLRTFVATYPTINVIVTSREAGFRVVAHFLATYCENFVVSNLTELEIKELSLKWHKAIIDETEATVKEANKLSELILSDNRIQALAENPLLLTTLLFVKRWAGYLPTKRSVLYQEMIKLLLVTWNVEGHEILDIEEAEPQLAFVAYWMTYRGLQTITADELNQCLIDARKQLPEILGYTKISPSEFIKRVESRSSLLILSGHKRHNSGQLTAIYEFLHLSFQEYLTAKAVVKRLIPQIDSNKKLIDILKPNVHNENWKEVIPLIAVLLERDTKNLIEYLISEIKASTKADSENQKKTDRLIPSLLGSCLANEIQISPELLGIAIEWYAKSYDRRAERGINEIILKNKFGGIFIEKVSECFFSKYEDRYAVQYATILVQYFETNHENNDNISSILKIILNDLTIKSKKEKCIAILGLMEIVFGLSKKEAALDYTDKTVINIFNEMLKLLKTFDPHIYFSISWCMAWTSKIDFPDQIRLSFIKYFLKTWVKINNYNMHRFISWALRTLLTPSVPAKSINRIPNLRSKIREYFLDPRNEFDKIAAIFVGAIINEKFDKKNIKEVFENNYKTLTRDSIHPRNSNYRQFYEFLGIDLNKLKKINK